MRPKLPSRLLAVTTVVLQCITFFACGCGSEPPAPTQEAIDQELQQLNQHRQREWNNE